jgi:hypothetical protein
MFGHLQNQINLQLVETHTFGSGAVLLRYQQALPWRWEYAAHSSARFCQNCAII